MKLFKDPGSIALPHCTHSSKCWHKCPATKWGTGECMEVCAGHFTGQCILLPHSIDQNSITRLYLTEEEVKNCSLAALTVCRRKIKWLWWARTILCEDWNHVFIHSTWTLRTESIPTVHINMSLIYHYIY